MTEIETDICVVGSGIAGAMVARKCVDAGLNVVMIEAGRPANGRALGLRVLEQLVRDYRIPRMRLWHRGALYARQDNLAAHYPVRGRALVVRGGTTLGWTGDAYRMPPEDFELFARTGRGIDWPLDYQELERHYGAAEEMLRVAGDHSDPGHPPRTRAFPIAAEPYHERDAAFLTELASGGIGAMHHNIALAKDGSVFTGDALIDELERAANFRLLVSTVALRVGCRNANTAEAVECLDTASGGTVRVGARSVVVCGGGIESPNLLARSQNQWWPDGLGSHSGHLGRHLTTHGGVAIGGRPRGLRLFDGPIVATAASRRYDTPAEQREGKFLLIWRPAPTGFGFLNAIFEQFSDSANTVRPSAATSRFGTPRAAISFQPGEQFLARQKAIGLQLEEMAARMGFRVTNRRPYMLAHHMCTTRMSADPAHGVLDADLRVHSLDNVYVCGGSSFASAGAANPTVTVGALAHRLGEHLTRNLARTG